MYGIFSAIVLLFLSSMFCCGSIVPEASVELSVRAGTFFGIPIPDYITDIPILGQLILNFAQLAASTSSAIFVPVFEALNVASSGQFTRNSVLFQVIDGATGGLMSALSGVGGLKPPAFDAQDLIKIANNISNHVDSDVGQISKPVFGLLNLPADVLEQAIKRFMEIMQGTDGQSIVAPTRLPSFEQVTPSP